MRRTVALTTAPDIYLDAFLDELHQQSLTCEIAARHPLEVAPIADLWTRGVCVTHNNEETIRGAYFKC